jgi:hypothetical protein
MLCRTTTRSFGKDRKAVCWKRCACGRHSLRRVYRSLRLVSGYRIGAAQGYCSGCLTWISPRVFRHRVGGGKHADALRRRSRARPCDLPFCQRGQANARSGLLMSACAALRLAWGPNLPKKSGGTVPPSPQVGESLLHHRTQSIKRNKRPNARLLCTTPHSTYRVGPAFDLGTH